MLRQFFAQVLSLPSFLCLISLGLLVYLAHRSILRWVPEHNVILSFGASIAIALGVLTSSTHIVLNMGLGPSQSFLLSYALTCISLGFLAWKTRGPISPAKEQIPIWQWALIALNFILFAYYAFAYTDGDFEHAYFSRIAQLNQGIYPPINHSFTGSRFYHDGAFLLSAWYGSLANIDAWASPKVIRLILSWSVLPIAVLIAKDIFNLKDRAAWTVGLLAAFGMSIRVWLGLLFQLLLPFTARDEVEKVFSMVMADYWPGTTIFFSIRDDTFHGPSILGIPLFWALMWLLLRILKGKTYSTILITGLVIALGICREDLLALLTISFVISMIASRQLKPFLLQKTHWAGLAIMLGCLALPGSLLGLKLSFSYELQEVNSFLQVLPDLQSSNSPSSSTGYSTNKFSFTPVPRLASWKLMNSRLTYPIFHPQILLELILDFSIGCFILLPLIFFRPKKDPSLWIFFKLILAIPLFIVLFFDQPAGSVQNDLQRILNYNLACFASGLYLLAHKNWTLPKWTVALLILPGILYIVIHPIRESGHNSFYQEHQRLVGQRIQKDWQLEGRPPVYIWNLPTGWTGIPSYFKNRFAHIKGTYNKQAIDLYDNSAPVDHIAYFVFENPIQAKDKKVVDRLSLNQISTHGPLGLWKKDL
jgi:hypothetical protein